MRQITLRIIRNNAVKIERKLKKKEKFTIFQFQPYRLILKKNYFTLNSQKFLQRFQAEFKIIPEIMDYWQKNNILLKILSKTSSKAEEYFIKIF